MAALRTVRCPACGQENLLGKPCPCGGVEPERRRAAAPRIVGIIATFVLTAGGITLASFALAETQGLGYGVALAVGAYLLLHLCRLGFDYEDGIDVRQLIFPAPFDWPVKIESLVNFWTAPRPYFRATYLGALLALAIVVITLLADRGA